MERNRSLTFTDQVGNDHSAPAEAILERSAGLSDTGPRVRKSQGLFEVGPKMRSGFVKRLQVRSKATSGACRASASNGTGSMTTTDWVQPTRGRHAAGPI